MAEEEELNEVFFHASEGGLTELERFCKKHKNALEQRDQKGRNALAYACLTDNLKNATFLVKKGQSWWDMDNNGATPLHWAVQGGAVKIIRQILQAGRHPEGIPSYLVSDKDGVTPFHIAAKRSSSKILKLLVDCVTCSDDVFNLARDVNGRSPLHYAAACASLECCQLILDTDVVGLPVDQKDKSGLTPLMCAVGVRLPQAVDIVRRLAIRKPVAVSARNNEGQTALHLAVAADDQLAIDVLLGNEINCEINPADSELRTPLHYAADMGFVDSVKKLLTVKAKGNDSRDKYGVTPAHYAAQNSTACLSLLLKSEKDQIKVGGDTMKVDVKDYEQRSSFMWAVVAGNMGSIEYLIVNSAPNRQEQDCRGFTALHLASMIGNESVCKLLVKQGWNMNERDKNDATPLHLAAGRGHTDVVRYLVTAGASMNELDNVKRGPVFSACFGGQAHTLYVMIKELCFEWRTVDCYGRKVPITDAMGRTPLHAAAYSGYGACINVLLGVGQFVLLFSHHHTSIDSFIPSQIEKEDDNLNSPFIGWQDKEGETALHVACYRGRIDVVIVLVKEGAAINALDSSMRTPLQRAIDAKYVHIVEYLRSQDALDLEELKEVAAKVIQTWYRQCRERRKRRQMLSIRRAQR